MTIVLQVPDEKAPALLEVLQSISYVEVEETEGSKEQFLQDLKEAVAEAKLIKAGKKKARSAKAFLNAL